MVVSLNSVPHCKQKRYSSGTSNPQLGQTISGVYFFGFAFARFLSGGASAGRT